jgi:hypothetical protein
METSKQVCDWRVAVLILVFALIAMHRADAQPSPEPVSPWSLNATVHRSLQLPHVLPVLLQQLPGGARQS